MKKILISEDVYYEAQKKFEENRGKSSYNVFDMELGIAYNIERDEHIINHRLYIHFDVLNEQRWLAAILKYIVEYKVYDNITK